MIFQPKTWREGGQRRHFVSVGGDVVVYKYWRRGKWAYGARTLGEHAMLLRQMGCRFKYEAAPRNPDGLGLEAWRELLRRATCNGQLAAIAQCVDDCHQCDGSMLQPGDWMELSRILGGLKT